MERCCDCCRYAVYDYPYDIGSESVRVDCRKADDMTEKEADVNWEENGVNCPFFEEEDHCDYLDYLKEDL